MPAQSEGSIVAAYKEGDTAPALARQLLDGNDQPINLTDCSVTITVAHASHSHYYSPGTVIVDRDTCDIDADQDNNTGWVYWTPEVGALSPPGEYQFDFEVTYADATRETIPPNTYLPLLVLPRPGGEA